MFESTVLSRYPFVNSLGTPPRTPNEAGIYSLSGIANALTLEEIDSLVLSFKAEGKLIPIEISAGGEPSIAALRSHLSPSQCAPSQCTSSIRSQHSAIFTSLRNAGVAFNAGNGRTYGISHASLMYRHLSRQSVRDKVEMLHCAEAYPAPRIARSNLPGTRGPLCASTGI